MSEDDNNRWHIYNNSQTVVVFVHGIISDSSGCWTHEEGSTKVFWPDLIESDPRILTPSIYLAGYFTSANSKGYDIRQCVEEVYDSLLRNDIHARRPVMDKENIIFVCHSTGGILVRYLLDIHRTAFKNKKIGLALIASPSLGSKYADRLGSLLSFYENSLGKQLKWKNELLEDLDYRFQFILSNNLLNIVGTEACESHFIKGRFWISRQFFKVYGFLFNPDNIVSSESGSRYFAPLKLIPDTDHFSISKPASLEHYSYKFLFDFLTQKYVKQFGLELEFAPCNDNDTRSLGLTKIIEGTEEITKEAYANNIDAVLFDVYQSNFVKFYHSRQVDAEFLAACKQAAVWICGESGVGKTTLVRKNLFLEGKKCIYLSLGITEPIVRDIFSAIYFGLLENLEGDFYTDELNDDISLIIKRIINLLRKFNEQRMVIHIDELPLDTYNVNEFSCVFAHLIESYQKESLNLNVKFVVSSIQNPVGCLENQSKVNSLVKLYCLYPWLDEDIKGLVNLIEEHTQLSLKEQEKELLINASNSSPRFIKKFFRNYLAKSSADSSVNVELVIKETTQELI